MPVGFSDVVQYVFCFESIVHTYFGNFSHYNVGILANINMDFVRFE